MKIAIASDASGFRLKEHVKQVLREAGHDVTDVGQQREEENVRYYEAGELLARAIQSGAYERGLVMCGSGAGVCMTAGKFRGVYAVACESEYTAAELRRIVRTSQHPLVLYVSAGVSAGLERFTAVMVEPLTFGVRIGARTISALGEDVDRRYRVLAEEDGALLTPLPGSTGDRLAAGR